MSKIYKPIFFLFFLFFLFFFFSLSSFSQSITDDLFLKQDVLIRDILTLKDYDLKGNPKKVINTSYQFDEKDGSKSKIGYRYVKHFSIQGLLTKEESYKTNDTIDKSVETYYYTGIRLDSVNGFRKRAYRYDKQGRLKKKIFYNSDKEKEDEEDFFYDNNNFINKVIQKSNKQVTTYNYDKNGNITLCSIHSDSYKGTQNKYLYDVFGDLSTYISDDKSNDIFTKISYKRVKDKTNNLLLSEITSSSNKSKTIIYYKCTYVYDSQGSLINITSFKNNKKTNVYESKVVYYTTDEINQKLSTDTVKKLSINFLETVLTKQLKQGASQTIDEAGAGLPKIQFEIDELGATVQIADEVLKSNGFKELNKEDFNQKVKNVFGRIIDPKSKSIFLYVNFFDKCDREFVMYNNQIDYNGIFIEKQRKIILKFYYIPELIDYQKQYSKLNNIENTKIIRKSSIDNLEIEIPHWKDIPNLKDQRKKNIQTLVARNMYLFNDSRAYFKWLLLNDQDFMQRLVTTFGYYDDKELVKWVIENTKFDSNNPNELDKIFWNKKCNKTVKLNLEIFPILKEIIAPQDGHYLETLKMYVMYLLEDKDKRNELSLQDRAKLLAHLVYFGEQYRYDEKYKDKSYFMQRIWMRDLDGSVQKEIIKNNYYNLPDYKNLYKKSEEYQNALADENGG